MFCARVASGGSCQGISRHVPRFTAISGNGHATACSTTSITRSSWPVVKTRAAKLRPRPRLSTPRPSRPQKKGPQPGSRWLRCGQESQRHQAQRGCRYDRTAAWHRGDPSQRSGSGWRSRSYQKDPTPVPLRPPRLCRWRLQRRETRRRSGGSEGYSGDCQAHGQGRRLQANPAAMGGRAHLLLAQAQPPLDGTLRSHRHHRGRLRQTRHDIRHAQTPNRAKAKAGNVKF